MTTWPAAWISSLLYGKDREQQVRLASPADRCWDWSYSCCQFSQRWYWKHPDWNIINWHCSCSMQDRKAVQQTTEQLQKSFWSVTSQLCRLRSNVCRIQRSPSMDPWRSSNVSVPLSDTCSLHGSLCNQCMNLMVMGHVSYSALDGRCRPFTIFFLDVSTAVEGEIFVTCLVFSLGNPEVPSVWRQLWCDTLVGIKKG